MAGETCEHLVVKPFSQGPTMCGIEASPCPKCLRPFCLMCSAVHQKEEHSESVISELDIEPDAAPTEVQEPPKPAANSAFDPLFVDPSTVKPVEPEAAAPEEPEEPVTEEKVGEMFSAEMGRVVAALDLLARRGLNQSAVIALIHDAEPKIPKSTIAAVLKAFRQLPEIYGRKRPGRKS